MLGTWTANELGGKRGRASITVFADAGAMMDVVVVGGDDASRHGATVLGFEAFPSTIGDKTYLNMRVKRWVGGLDSDKTVTDTEWLIVRYEVDKDTLTLWTMREDAIKGAVEAKLLAGSVDPALAGDVHVTSDSAVLAAYVKGADQAKLFSRLGTFRRQR